MTVARTPILGCSLSICLVFLTATVSGEPEPQTDLATSTESTKPAGPPDYTRLAEYIDGSALPRKVPTVVWKFSSEIRTTSDGPSYMIDLTDPVVADGVIYFADRGTPGLVFALKTGDGAEVWQYEHLSGGIHAAPSVDGDHVYFGSESGITALRRDNGEVVWEHAIELGAGGVTIPVGDRVFASGYDGQAYALDRATGRVIWKHDFVTDAPEDQPGFSGERARFQDIVARPRGAACDGKLFIQGVFDQSRPSYSRTRPPTAG